MPLTHKINVMKSFLLLFLLASAMFVSADEKTTQLQSFLSEVITVNDDQLSGTQPIGDLAEILTGKAEKVIVLTKENIVSGFEDAKNYKHALIIVGRHTLVKITDLNDCRASGAWGTCMPKGKALIQKSGVFSEKEDYINNLIGIPDGQTRKLFLLQ